MTSIHGDRKSFRLNVLTNIRYNLRMRLIFGIYRASIRWKSVKHEIFSLIPITMHFVKLTPQRIYHYKDFIYKSCIKKTILQSGMRICT